MIKLYQVLVDKPLAISERVRTELNQVLLHKPEKPNQVILYSVIDWMLPYFLHFRH
jgi:hypothetical protein